MGTNMKLQARIFFQFLLLFILLFPEISLAYIDPATGSFILQMVIGGVAGGLVFIKLFWSRLVSVFRRHVLDKLSN